MGHDHTAAELRRAMQARFGIAAERVRFVRAPYRICPLGAHIDHQLGTVTAQAIDRGVLLAFAASETREIRLGSLAYPGEVRFSLGQIPPRQSGEWGNYARGAATALGASRELTHGIVGVTSGELAEMGLSSSASIGLAYLLALEEANGLSVSAGENIRLDQAIENQYLGLNNGILDQAAILLSRRDCLTVINCRKFAQADENSVTSSSLPPGVRLSARSPALPSFTILLAFSGLTQPIVSTDYNRRVAECAEAARVLLHEAGRPEAPARLAEVSQAEYETGRASLPIKLARRAEHFFSEMNRVQLGVRAWEHGDLATFGRLVRESGRSSIVNYECGCPPMIDLHDILLQTDGIYGTRFSGAGFRGCCVALVDPALAEEAVRTAQQAYAARHPQFAAQAKFLLCAPDDGARLL